MQLSTKGRYAVMAIADLALHGGEEKAVSLADIAGRQEISQSYLEQLFAKLRRAGVVASARGPGGGYRLARPAAETRIADIVLAVDEPLRVTRCDPETARGCLKQGTAQCLTHDLWDALTRQIHLFLAAVSVADVLAKRLPARLLAAE
jgi:Rrf2 family iron-sulfur cluster assembly transcriptional regulator